MKSNLQPDSADLELRADSLFLAGSISEAAVIYRKVLECEPGRLDIQARLGRLALFENDPGRAIIHLTSALNNGLRSKAHWDTLADAYLANGEPGSAALCYERAGRTGLAGTLAVMASRQLCRIEGAVGSLEFAWLPKSPLPLIQAKVNGVLLNLLVDTAAGDLMLDEKVAIDIGIPHGGQELCYFAGGLPARVTYGHVESLQLGTLVMHDLLTQILDLQGRFAEYSPLVPIHGILGISFLSRFQTVLDFQQRALRLHPGAQSPDTSSAGVGTNESPFWIAGNHFIVVQAEIPNTESSMWVIDTGMAGAAFAVSTATAETFGRIKPVGKQEVGVGGGGIVQGQRVMFSRLRLGHLDRRDVEGMALKTFPLKDRFGFQIAGLLSCDYFQETVLAMDFSRMTLAVS